MSDKNDTAAIVGVGAAACAVCCAGPIVGLLAGIGIGAAAGFAVFGIVGLVIATLIAVVMHRRRRAEQCAPTPDTVMLELATRSDTR